MCSNVHTHIFLKNSSTGSLFERWPQKALIKEWRNKTEKGRNPIIVASSSTFPPWETET